MTGKVVVPSSVIFLQFYKIIPLNQLLALFNSEISFATHAYFLAKWSKVGQFIVKKNIEIIH